jgi:hypothetical protein
MPHQHEITMIIYDYIGDDLLATCAMINVFWNYQI